ATNNTRSCLACHQNISEMRLSNSDNDAGTFDADNDGVNGTNISAYHYGKKRADMRSGVNTSCSYCHQNSTTAFENVMLGISNKSIYEHTDAGARNTSAGSCTGSKCHATGFIHNATLTKPPVQNWTQGSKDYCAPCHKINDANATKYVYSHNTTATPINEDCGYCHNASSQGINGSTVRVHSPALTNTTTSSIYASCTGCHNGTSLYVGSGKQILSHMPNASQYRGNTTTSSYTCEYCHNLSGKPSMHSTGMNRSNGTCNTCHFNRTSPYKSTKKIIASSDYNHTYVGQKTCAAAQCHNASNGSVFHMDKYAAGVVAEPEKFNSLWNDRYTMGFTESSYPYVDCIDCHRAPYNNSYPFNNTYPFNYSTNYSFNYESNHTGENKKTHTTADTIASCYNCHTNRTDAADRYMVHNVTIEPLAGGPACIKCHNLSATGDVPSTKRVNHTSLNQSVHKNLTNFTVWNNSPHKATAVLLDSACWTCHASDITDIPGNEHPDRGGPSSFKKPFQCKECHTPGGNVSITNPQVFHNATKVYKHYAGKIFVGSKAFNATKECYECHKNGLLNNTNVSYSADYKYKNEANLSHYGDRSALIDTRNSTESRGCTKCHESGQSGSYYG
ncbi:MAG: hypothetical protein Q7U60_12680, partial [Candidatus Methanoperedens sp.]|nr:hypothetical protein [Candidatus Methanoperedens sp.]